MNMEKLLRDMSAKLGLRFEAQDWGIINADPSRLLEFIQFYESPNLSSAQRFELGELIIASANERLLAGASITDEGLNAFVHFIHSYGSEQEVNIAYWTGLDDPESFPVARLLTDINRK